MIKAYNTTWIQNLQIVAIANKWRSKNLLTSAQEAQVKTAFPEHFYRPGFFVKFGLFIFTLIGCAACIGFMMMFFMNSSPDGNAFILISVGAAGAYLAFLEKLIRHNKLYHAGADNALLYAAITAIMAALFLIFEKAGFKVHCILFLAITLTATLRYADILTALGSFAALFALTGNLLMQFPLGKSLLPFAFMLLAAFIYSSVRLISDLYYQNCKMLLKGISLLVFYLSGNYLIVREGNAMLHELHMPIAPQIDFAPLFYIFTTIIPLTYIASGLKKHDRLVLIIGLLCLAFSVYTYRHYFSLLTPAQELVVAGIVLIAAAVGAMRYLRTPKHRLSDEPEDRAELSNLEAMIVAQGLAQAPGEKGTEFGGGDFGGGGAGAVY